MADKAASDHYQVRRLDMSAKFVFNPAGQNERKERWRFEQQKFFCSATNIHKNLLKKKNLSELQNNIQLVSDSVNYH